MIYIFTGLALILVLIFCYVFLARHRSRGTIALHRHAENRRRKRGERTVWVTGEYGTIEVPFDPVTPPDSFYFVAKDSDIA